MTRYVLTVQQEELLRAIVQFSANGQLSDEFVPIPIGNPTEYALHLRGAESFRFKSISDLDALCDAGLATFRWNRQGVGKLFSITEAGFAAVANDFEVPFSNPGPRYQLDLIVRAMSGQPILMGHAKMDSEIAKIARDPILLYTKLEELTEKLIEAVQPDLDRPAWLAYSQAARDLQEQISTGIRSLARLEEQVGHLAFVNGNAGTLPLMLKVWPLLYPIALIAVARSEQQKRAG